MSLCCSVMSLRSMSLFSWEVGWSTEYRKMWSAVSGEPMLVFVYDHFPYTWIIFRRVVYPQATANKPVSRELHAFCHLFPADPLAATKFPTLNKDALMQLSQACKEAINRWCFCSRDYEVQLECSKPYISRFNSHCKSMYYCPCWLFAQVKARKQRLTFHCLRLKIWMCIV